MTTDLLFGVFVTDFSAMVAPRLVSILQEALSHLPVAAPPGLALAAIILDMGIRATKFANSKDWRGIIDVKVHPHNVEVLKHFSSLPKGSVQSFAVIEEGDFLTLRHEHVKFGRLNKGLCRHLHDLVANAHLNLQALIPTKDLFTALRSRKSQMPEYLPAEINVYGPKADATEIGSIMSRSGIFLQLPLHGIGAIEYFNPQMIRIEGYPDRLPPEVHSSTDDTDEVPDRYMEASMRGNDTAVVDSILDSLSHHRNIQEIATVPDIKSRLFDHQKEAVDFIRQRETMQINSDLSLWQYNDMDDDEPFYQHVLSGTKRPEPSEARGGIIADEMGLGKSLVVIYTIASSLDRAKAFVAAESRKRQSEPQVRIASKATLIIAPSSLLIDNWVDEVSKHTRNGALPFHRHIGSWRHQETRYLYERPIVFTTYATVAAEFRRGDNTLTKINWFRIVLDEAHDVRNRSTKQFQAVASIPALHRWCLTGTPIQNSLEDLGALVSFLRVPILEQGPTFRKLITNPINSVSRSRFKNLHTLLRAICLRRTQQSCLDLPEPISKQRRLDLTPLEHSDYQALLVQGRIDIDMAVSRRGKGNVNSAFLESLLKLRLFCNNGRENAVMQSGPTGLPTDPDEALIYLQQYEQNVCVYCSAIIYFIDEVAGDDGGVFISGCSHLLCHSCVPINRAEKNRCPTCARQPRSASQTTLLSERMLTETPQSHSVSRNGRTIAYPSKLLALMSDVIQDSHHKSIVFSSWKKTLLLVGQLFTDQGIRYDIIDGTLPLSKRINVLKNFRLNLAVASRIYLLEPQWNPSIESQAIGRALRLGQTDQVVITRYIMKSTIEESNVLFRQKRKLELAGGGFNQSDKLQALQNIFGVDVNPAAG
ncbi:hypothetical protein G7054_g8020 [Neopestalotiopsis clavispora]|nr:hypothetical protein G7054_g8020 [Neopestalotiopsis clavispora]